MQSISKPSLYAAALTALWIVLAWSQPATTYHLAPFLVAVVVPGAVAMSDEPAVRPAALGALIGAGLALGATVLLGATDHLTGPSLLPSGGAVLEAVVFAGAGAAVGALFAAVRAR